MGMTVGIDLGTTNSAVARIDGHGYPVIIPNAQGSPTTPSVICFTAGEIFIGADAKEMQAAGEPEIAAFFKRHMGDPNFLFDAYGIDYSPVELSALLLGKLRADAEQVTGQKITGAVITVPAYFKNPEREATRLAAQRAGLNVLQLVNEPTAAAIAYGANRMNQNSKMLVYDLGGGTFDVTLCKREGDDIRIITSVGDHALGGKDWDDRIAQFAALAFDREFGVDPHADSISIADVLARAEETKKRLTNLQAVRISLVHAGHRGTYELTRAQFETMTQDLMQRTIDLCGHMLADMAIAPESLDAVLLVGGSTRMPQVHDFIRKNFGKPPSQGINVDEAVALGAAVVAAGYDAGRGLPAIRGRRTTADVTNHSLGMIAVNHDATAYINSIILPKNHPVPCAETRPYKFQTRGDNRLEIFMTQGEAESPADVTFIGKYIVTDIPTGAGNETVLDIQYSYDASGTVRVDGRTRGSKKDLTIVTEPLPGDLPDRFLERPKGVGGGQTTIYIAIDLSGSMSGTPLLSAQKAARDFLDTIDLAHCALGIMGVADRTVLKLNACQNARAIRGAIDSLSIGVEAGGGNRGHPFDDAYSLMAYAPGRRFLIVLADGMWDCQEKAIEQAKLCHAAGIEIVAIGFGSADAAFLRAIASSDEGSLLTTMASLSDTFSSIAQVITESNNRIAASTMFGRLRGG